MFGESQQHLYIYLGIYYYSTVVKLARREPMRRSLGKFSKRTRCLRKRAGQKSVPMRRLLGSFSIGDKVCINLAPSQQGLPHPRYRGRHGVIVAMRGKSYVVDVKSGNSYKRIILPGMHLKK